MYCTAIPSSGGQARIGKPDCDDLGAIGRARGFLKAGGNIFLWVLG